MVLSYITIIKYEHVYCLKAGIILLFIFFSAIDNSNNFIKSLSAVASLLNVLALPFTTTNSRCLSGVFTHLFITLKREPPCHIVLNTKSFSTSFKVASAEKLGPRAYSLVLALRSTVCRTNLS